MNPMYARIYWDGQVTGIMRIRVLGEADAPGVAIIELPWTEKGEPAGLFRRGMAVGIPIEEIIDSEVELQTSLDKLHITKTTVQHAISEIVDKVTTRRIAIKTK